MSLQGDCTGLEITNADLTKIGTWRDNIKPHHRDPDGIKFTDDGLFVAGTGGIQHYNQALSPDKNSGTGGNINDLAAYEAKNAQKTILFTADSDGKVFHHEFENGNFSNRIQVSGAWEIGAKETSVAYDPELHEVYIVRRNPPLQLKRAKWNGASWNISQPLIIGKDSNNNDTININALADPASIIRIDSLLFNTFDRKLYFAVTGGGGGSRILRLDPHASSPQVELFVLLSTSVVGGTVKMLNIDDQGNLYGTIVDGIPSAPQQRGIVMFQRFQQ